MYDVKGQRSNVFYSPAKVLLSFLPRLVSVTAIAKNCSEISSLIIHYPYPKHLTFDIIHLTSDITAAMLIVGIASKPYYITLFQTTDNQSCI